MVESGGDGGSFGAAVENALADPAMTAEAADAAARELARHYAKELDSAEWIGRAADKVLRRVLDDPASDLDLIEQVQALQRRLTARATLENLGPKLLAALTALHATPDARAKAKGGGPGGKRQGGSLAALRAGRAG